MLLLPVYGHQFCYYSKTCSKCKHKGRIYVFFMLAKFLHYTKLEKKFIHVIFNKFFKYCFPFPRWADSASYKINNIVMPILLAWSIEFVHIEQVSASFTFRLGQVLLYYLYMGISSVTITCICESVMLLLPVYADQFCYYYLYMGIICVLHMEITCVTIACMWESVVLL
jgi:hypothetical protein